MRNWWLRLNLWWLDVCNISIAVSSLQEQDKAHSQQIDTTQTIVEAHRQQIVILDRKIEDLRSPVKSYGDVIGGFSRDLQIIRDQIKREWKADVSPADFAEAMDGFTVQYRTMEERVAALENPPKQIGSIPEPDDALSRIAAALDRAFPVPAPPPAPPPSPSDLSNLTTVTSEDADEKTRFWRGLARKYGIAPDSDLFQEMILHYETEVAARGFKPQEIDWDQVFREANDELGQAGAEEVSVDTDGEPAGDTPRA